MVLIRLVLQGLVRRTGIGLVLPIFNRKTGNDRSPKTLSGPNKMVGV